MRTSPSYRLLLAASFAALTALAPAAPASAQRVDIGTPHRGDRPIQLDIHGGFAWSGVGLATGVRLGIPIVSNGFVDSINNAVYINFGADFYYVRWGCGSWRGGCDNGRYYGFGLGFPLALHWEFYFNDTWSAFAEVGGQFFIHPGFWDHGRWDDLDPYYFFIWAVGGSLHISENFLLTVRFGTPYAAAGITFQF